MSELAQNRTLLPGLSPECTAALTQGARKRSFDRGEAIFHKGDPGASMFVILKGQVKIVLPWDGGEEAIASVGGGAVGVSPAGP